MAAEPLLMISLLPPQQVRCSRPLIHQQTTTCLREPDWRHVAVIWAVFFAYSLSLGRILSLIVDGMPSPILLFYLAVELTVGTLGLLVLSRERREGRVP